MSRQHQHPGDHHDSNVRLERYLDGLMSPTERASFEEAMTRDEALQASVAMQRRIDDSLRRLATPPATPQLNGVSPHPQVTSGQRVMKSTGRGRQWLAIAASLVMTFLGVWQIVRWNQARQPVDVSGPLRTLQVAYEDAAGGKIDFWECEDQVEFAHTFRGLLGVPLALSETPPGTQALGLAYSRVISSRSVCLMGRHDGQDLLVVIDLARSDLGQTLPTDSPLHLYRVELGPLVLYEVTPLQRATLLPLLNNPDNGQAVDSDSIRRVTP